MIARWSITIVPVLLAASVARADTVKLLSKPAFRNVRVTGFRDGRLVFRGVSRQLLRKPLDQVEWIELDDEPAFTRAEQAAATGQWEQSVGDYAVALDRAGDDWRRGLVLARTIAACDRAGRFDRAVTLYVEFARHQSEVAAAIAPRHPDEPGSEANAAARRTLRDALDAAPNAPASAALRRLALELAIYDEVSDVAAAIQTPRDAPAPPASSQPASAAGRRLGMLTLEPVRVEGDSPLRPGTEATVLLPPDSFVLEAAERAFEQGHAARAARLIERALAYVAPADRERWELLLYRAWIDDGRAAEAASELMRLSRSAGAAGAEALYYVGVAHERLDRPDVARGLYRELLQRDDLPALLRARAQLALTRVGE